jgi:hypothetical protein
MVSKTMDTMLFMLLGKATLIMATFELWMFRGGFDTFALDMVNYTIKNGNHVILLLASLKFMKFQQAMIVQLTNLLACYELHDKMIACVKSKGQI